MKVQVNTTALQATISKSSTLTDNSKLVDEVLKSILKSNGTLRATKPSKGSSSLAKYVWRMVAFVCVPSQRSMPVTADFDLYDFLVQSGECGTSLEAIRACMSKTSAGKALADELVEAVTQAISKDQWVNIRAWGRALTGGY